MKPGGEGGHGEVSLREGEGCLVLHALQIYSTPVTLRHLEIGQPLAHSSARLGKHQPKHLCHHDSPRVVLPSVVLFR